MTSTSGDKRSRAERAADDSPIHYRLSCITEDVEYLDRYTVGGYHPINLNDRLYGRYKIFHKLGFGSFSTIWLARDQDTDLNVAIKILTADNDRPRESEILSVLNEDGEDTAAVFSAAHSLIPVLLDRLDVEGPNGHHHCLVMPPTSSSLSDALDPEFPVPLFQLPVPRAIAAQVAQAVKFVHAKGVVHGDLHTGNVLFCLPKTMVDLPPEGFYEACDGPPTLLDVTRADGKPLTANVPVHAVAKALIGKAAEDVELREAIVLLADFGESFQPEKTARLDSRTPLMSRAPEHVLPLSTPMGFASDIWSLGCLLVRVMGRRELFQMFLPSEDSVLRDQIAALGPLPAELFSAWGGRGRYFDEEQQTSHRETGESLSDRIDVAITKPRAESQCGQLEADELEAFQLLLRSMLAMKAGNRISATEVLESEWMVKWALPDLDRARELWRKDEYEVQDASLEASVIGGKPKEESCGAEQQDEIKRVEEAQEEVGGERAAPEGSEETKAEEEPRDAGEESRDAGEEKNRIFLEGAGSEDGAKQGGQELAEEGQAEALSKDGRDPSKGTPE